jgi:hypothetical protein
VLDSAPRMSGYDAGIVPGMRVLQVNGAPFSLAVLEEAVRKTHDHGPLLLQVANGSASELHRLDYHEGLKYPHLERLPSTPDLLHQMVAPQTPVTPPP